MNSYTTVGNTKQKYVSAEMKEGAFDESLEPLTSIKKTKNKIIHDVENKKLNQGDFI